MNRHLGRRIEAVTRRGFEESYVGAQLHLAEFAELTTPDDDWQTPLESARSGLIVALEQATTSNEYYKARIMYETAPLFTLPLLEGTIDTETIRSNVKRIRKNLVQLAIQIRIETDGAYKAHRVAFTREEERYYRDMRDDLLGVGNEASVIAALLTMGVYQQGYVPVPAFTWEDDGKFDLLQHRYTSNPDESTLTDAKLIPLSPDLLPKKVQIKTKANDQKKYADDITVISCYEIAVAVSEQLGLQPQIGNLPELFCRVPGGAQRAQAIELVGKELASQLGIGATKKNQLAS